MPPLFLSFLSWYGFVLVLIAILTSIPNIPKISWKFRFRYRMWVAHRPDGIVRSAGPAQKARFDLSKIFRNFRFTWRQIMLILINTLNTMSSSVLINSNQTSNLSNTAHYYYLAAKSHASRQEGRLAEKDLRWQWRITDADSICNNYEWTAIMWSS